MGTCTSKYKTPTRSLSLTSRLISIPSPPSPPPSQVFFAPQLLHDYWVALFETQKRTEPFTLATPNRVADYCKATGNRPPPSFNPPSSTAPSASAPAMRAMVVAADLVSNGGTVGGAVVVMLVAQGRYRAVCVVWWVFRSPMTSPRCDIPPRRSPSIRTRGRGRGCGIDLNCSNTRIDSVGTLTGGGGSNSESREG